MNRTTRLRIFGVVTVLAALLSNGMVQAKPGSSSRVIKLQTNRSGWAEVRIPKATTISPSTVRIAAGEQYGGFAVFRKGATQPSIGQVEFPKGSDGPAGFSRVNFNDPAGSVTLSPGSYVFYLLGSGKTTVEIPVTGLNKSITLKKFKTVQDQTMVVEPGAPTSSASDFTVGSKTVIVTGARLNNALAAYEFCLTAVDEECIGLGGTPGPGTFQAQVARGESSSTHSAFYPGQSGYPEAGEYEIVYRIFGSGTTEWSELGYAIVFDLAK